MNTQEAIEQIRDKSERFYACDYISCNEAVDIIRKIDKPQKPRVPQVAVEFYEEYEADNLDLGEWFSDFYSDEAIEQFPRMEELAEWLHGNDRETNRQREFALATLVTFGIDAVEVEKEKLYVVEIAEAILTKITRGNNVQYKFLNFVDVSDVFEKTIYTTRLTEREIKQKDERLWQFAKEVDDDTR